MKSYRRALECLLGTPATDGNSVEVLRNGDEAFPAMLDAVAAATRTVDLQTFGPWNGSIGEDLAGTLAGRVKAGVRARVLLDALGYRQVDRALVDRMSEAGVEVRWFRPLTNWRVTQSTHRGHRRVLVCDGEIGFTGGIGIADRWRGDARDPSEWRDTHLRVQGPAVNGLRGAFVDNWAETKQPLFDEEVDPLPRQEARGPSSVQVVRGKAETGWGDMSTLVRSLIGLARERLRISASFLVPDDSALESLAAAVDRGVDVELLRPGPYVDSQASQMSSRAQYERLHRVGVKVWEFQPCMLNAKIVTVDGQVASVGPMNFNSRSLTMDDEVSVVVFDREVVGLLDSHFDADLARSEQVDVARRERRPPHRRMATGALGFLARHL